MLILGAFLPGIAAAQEKTGTDLRVAGSVVVPDMFDPNRRLDRPDLASLKAIRFTTTDDFPPFNFNDTAGQLTGFNVDLARAICTELAVPCTIQARPWDGLVDTVAAGRVDAAIAGIAINADNRSKLDFSSVYMPQVGRFVARRAALPGAVSPLQLADRRIGVVRGSTHAAYLDSFFPKSERVPFDTPELAREALKSGKVDLLFADGMQLSFWLQSEPAGNCCAFVGGPYIEPRIFGEGMAIALPPGHPELRRAFDWALDSLYDKGVFAELYLRYFPIGYL